MTGDRDSNHSWLTAVTAELEASDFATSAADPWAHGPARLYVISGEREPWLARATDDLYELIGPAVALLAVELIDAAVFVTNGSNRFEGGSCERVRVAFGVSRRDRVGVIRRQSAADSPLIDVDPIGSFPDAVEDEIRNLTE